MQTGARLTVIDVKGRYPERTMLLRLITAAGLTMVMISGCAEGPTQHTSQSGASVQNIIDAALQVRPEMDAREALKPLGEPARVETEPIHNRHRPLQVDTLRTLEYPGLTVTVYDATALDKSLITSLKITAPGYEIHDGLAVGMNRDRALESILNPRWKNGDTLTAALDGDGPPHELVVTFDGDQVATLVWHFYID